MSYFVTARRECCKSSPRRCARIRPVLMLAASLGALCSAQSIASFAASATTINPGMVTKLSWAVAGTTGLSIDQAVGDVSAQTSIYVAPTQTTTYTLTAFNGGKSATSQLQVTVVDTTPPAFGNGITYYVSPTGNDGNDGRSPETAWSTVARVNAQPLQPGETVLFQRGGEWRESLKVPSSGTADNPIAFADYGAGPKPKFWGSTVLNNAAFQSAGNGIYRYPISTPVLSALVDHTFFYYAGNSAASSLLNSFSYDNGVLEINSPGSDPRFDGRVYTAVLREDLIFSNAKDHLIFRNLVTDESASFSGGYGIRVENSSDVLVDSCEVYRAGKHHVAAINSTGFVGKNLYAAWAMPGQGHGGATAYVSYGDDSTKLPDQTSEWDSCVWDHPADPQDRDSYYAFYAHGSNVGLVTVNNMSSLGGNFSLARDNPDAVMTVNGGLIQNGRVEVFGGPGPTLIDGLHLTGASASIDLFSSNTVLQNILLDGSYAENGDGYKTAILSRGSGNVIRFSTIVIDSRAPSSYSCVTLDNDSAPTPTGTGAAFQYYGNICVTPNVALKQWDSYPLAADLAVSQYNLYSSTASFIKQTSSILTFREWQALGMDAHSLQRDPLFADPAHENYPPLAGSPAVAAVPVSPSWLIFGFPVPTDFLGNSRPAPTYDLGAISFSGAKVTRVGITPRAIIPSAGQTIDFSALVPDSSNQQVSWSLQPGAAGTISASGVYTTPLSLSGAGSDIVQAFSLADSSKVGTAIVTLQPVSLSVDPGNSTVRSGQSLQLGASVTGSTNQQVSWMLLSGPGGVDGSVYLAPVTASVQIAVVQVTSAADPSKFVNATITVLPALKRPPFRPR